MPSLATVVARLTACSPAPWRIADGSWQRSQAVLREVIQAVAPVTTDRFRTRVHTVQCTASTSPTCASEPSSGSKLGDTLSFIDSCGRIGAKAGYVSSSTAILFDIRKESSQQKWKCDERWCEVRTKHLFATEEPKPAVVRAATLTEGPSSAIHIASESDEGQL